MSSTYRVLVASTAQDDVRTCARFLLKKGSPQASTKWRLELRQAIAELRKFPCRFQVIAEAQELGFLYRDFNFYSHRVVYAVHEDEKLVIVHRIYHQARQQLTSEDI